MRIGIPEGRRLKLVRTAEEVWRHRRRVSVRLVCQLVGQIISMQLALGLVCRLRSRYLLHSVREAARAGDYRGVTGLCSRAMDEVKLFATQVDALEEQPMHKHKRKADYVMHCDASDHALAAIIIEARPRRTYGNRVSDDFRRTRRPGRRSSASSLAIAMHT